MRDVFKKNIDDLNIKINRKRDNVSDLNCKNNYIIVLDINFFNLSREIIDYSKICSE